MDKQTQAIVFDPQKEREAQRQRKIAEMLMEKGNTPFKNETAGGMTVKRSPWEHINQNAQKFMGEYKLEQADNAEAELEQRRQQMISEALAQYGSDPQAAAMMLGQDPRTSQVAMQLMGNEVNYGRQVERDELNHQRQQERFQQGMALKREAMAQREALARQKMSGSGEGGLMSGTGYDQQLTNFVYQRLIAQGVPQEQAAMQAYDTVLQSKQTMSKDPVTGQPVLTPRAPVFGVQAIQPGGTMGGEMMNNMPMNPAPAGPMTPNQSGDPTAMHAMSVEGQQQQYGANPMQRPDLAPQPQQPERTAYQAAERGTGPLSAAAQLYANVGGLVNAPQPEQTLRDRQFLEAAMQNFRKSLAITPRFNEGDIKRITDEMGKALSPSVMTNPEQMRIRMRELDLYLNQEMRKAEQDSNDTSLPVKTRQDARSNVANIRNFLQTLGVPRDQPEQQSQRGSGVRFLGFE